MILTDNQLARKKIFSHCVYKMNGLAPSCILIFSGKRKSGKDFITEQLLARVGSNKAVIIRLSAPIKTHWAQLHALDLSQLLNSSDYKEQHRLAMIQWSEEQRAKDYGFFCQLAVKDAQDSKKPVWIVSDARRLTDLCWFREQFGTMVKTVRIEADEQVRIQRGWSFTTGVDDVASECGLDHVDDWDWKFTNNGGYEEVELALQTLIQWIEHCLS